MNRDNSHILVLSGELDLYNAQNLKQLSTELIGSSSGRIIINMEKVEYIDSTGVGVILHIHSATKKKEIPFYLTNVHGTVEKVFRLTKLLGYLPIKNNIEEII